MEDSSAHWRDDDEGEASSSRGAGRLQPTVEDDHHGSGDETPEDELLAADPLDGDLTNRFVKLALQILVSKLTMKQHLFQAQAQIIFTHVLLSKLPLLSTIKQQP